VFNWLFAAVIDRNAPQCAVRVSRAERRTFAVQ
jgi:hypothetical protein